MADYAIGDIQGCYQSFRLLLEKIQFRWSRDRLWLAGDMINRGPESLQTLKYIYKHRDNIGAVLGNHDLHFLAVAAGEATAKGKDTLDDILEYDKKDKLIQWLSKQPLAIDLKEHQCFLSHAGVYPLWTVKKALKLAEEVQDMVQSPQAHLFYRDMYGNEPALWDKDLKGMARLRFITNCFTRMRYLREDFSLELDTKTPPGKQADGLRPWFEYQHKKWDRDIIFGHWAALNGEAPFEGLYALDTGCVWGGSLTALRLQDRKLFSVQSAD